MKKNGKFSPQAKAEKQISKASSNEALSSLSADVYKRALSTMSRALNPETGSNDSICTFSSTGRTTTVFKPKIVADIEVDTGYFKIVAFPRFRNPLAMTNGNRLGPNRMMGSRVFTTAPAIPSQTLQPPGKPTEEKASLLVPYGQYSLPAFTLEGVDVPGCLIPQWDNTRKIWAYKMAPSILDDRMTLYFDSSDVLVVRFYTRVGSTWSQTVVTAIVQGMHYYVPFTFPIGTEEFGISVSAGTAPDVASVRRVIADILLAPKINIDFLHYYNSDIVSTVEDAADAFLCAGMSLWTQYTGSDLVNGGEIAGYRYPPFNLTGYSNLETSYQEVSSTPGALVGQLKHGAYGFYIPANERELGFLPMETQSGLGCLIVVGRKTTADSTLRVNFNQYLVVSTTNQAFSKQLLPADPEAITVAYSMLREADPVIKNDGHKAKISRVLNWYKTHEKSIKQGLTTAAKLAKIAGPIIGSLLI